MADRRVEWVSRHLRRNLSDLESAFVGLLCDAFATGPWNLVEAWRNMRLVEDIYCRCSVWDEMCTVDGNALTALVFAAHDRCMRVTVRPAGPRRLEIRAWQRTREGRLSERHPTLEEAVAQWRSEVHHE